MTDPGVSGGKPLAKRKGGNQLRSGVSERKAQAVGMLKLDRMFRNAGDCPSTVKAWEKPGVALRVIGEGNATNTYSAAGRFMLVCWLGLPKWNGI